MIKVHIFAGAFTACKFLVGGGFLQHHASSLHAFFAAAAFHVFHVGVSVCGEGLSVCCMNALCLLREKEPMIR